MKLINLKYLGMCNRLLITVLLGSLVACTSSGRTSIDTHSTEASANFSQLKTYRWDYSALGKIQPDGSHMPELDRVVCEHVDKIMSEKGKLTGMAAGAALVTSTVTGIHLLIIARSMPFFCMIVSC